MNYLYILSIRFAQAVPVLLLVSVFAFLLMHMLPGDPAVVIAGSDATPESVDVIRRQLGLDRPLYEQLFHWVSQLLQGNFGHSMGLNQSVLSVVYARLPVTLSLALIAFLITLPSGIILGSLAAFFRGTRTSLLDAPLEPLGRSPREAPRTRRFGPSHGFAPERLPALTESGGG